jgi:hypothetical protein
MKKLFASVVVWLKGEPVVAAVVAADAVTGAAHFGVHLDSAHTLALGIVCSAIAAWAARASVTPTS